MISKDTFIRKIRDMGYCFKSQQKRTMLFRQKGSTEIISVPKADKLEDEWVVHTLRQKGLTKEEIQEFISSAKS